MLPNGNVFMGWGSEPYFSEFSKDGELLFDAGFPSELESYRAFRFPWKGQPQTNPPLSQSKGPRTGDALRHWNGATRSPPGRFSQYPALTGWSPLPPSPKGLRDRDNCTHDEPYISVKAKDRTGRVLAPRSTKAGNQTLGE